jgi:2-keto-3-deoxy-galactonokinase
LRKKGFLFVLRYVHAKGFLAKGLLGYEVAKSENAIASAIYIDNQLQLKTIPSSQLIYKFYFKNLEYQNVFLGKWDADTTWEEALKNHLNAYKFEKKLK